jgi:hypothetical protein
MRLVRVVLQEMLDVRGTERLFRIKDGNSGE